MNASTRKGLTLATMCLATFVAILDTTVVNLALHAIQDALHAGVSTLQWVLDAYNLTYASFILTGGVLGDLLGRRRVFAVGMALFLGGSVVCATAPGPGVLVAGRAISGLGAALQLPGALSILAVTFADERERSRAIAIWGGFNGLAMGVGPTAGGFLVDHFGWRSIFWLVLPFGVAILGLTAIGVSETSDPAGRRLDPLGQVLSVTALGLLTFALIEAPALGWSSLPTLATLALSAAVAGGFALVERSRADALLPLDLFRTRAFSASIASAALMTFAFYGFIFVFPLFLQSVRGQSAISAGVALLPMSLTFFVLSPVAGRLLPSVGPGPLVGGGMALMGAGVVALAGAGSRAPALALMLPLVAMGLGMALATGPLMTVAVSSIPRRRSGTSSGMVNVGRMVGATLGVAVAGSIFRGEGSPTGSDPARFSQGMHAALLVGGLAELCGAALAVRALGPGVLRGLAARLRSPWTRQRT